MPEKIICCRWAPSLGDLESTHEKVWGTKPYDPETDLDKPTVFMGLYGLNDYHTFLRHRGQKWVLWCGSDIRHLQAGYWLDEVGEKRADPLYIADMLQSHEHYVENRVEQAALAELGIRAFVVPSFLGDVTVYHQSYQHSERPKVYTSVSGDDFELYGWDKIPELARENPEIEFHCYGNTIEPPWIDPEKMVLFCPPNVVLHGRVPKEQMNAEIAQMQGALRLTTFDGFSEILCKSILWGQWPVSLIPYPHMLKLSEIGKLKELKEPNTAGREHYLKILNNYPWNAKK